MFIAYCYHNPEGSACSVDELCNSCIHTSLGHYPLAAGVQWLCRCCCWCACCSPVQVPLVSCMLLPLSASVGNFPLLASAATTPWGFLPGQLCMLLHLRWDSASWSARGCGGHHCWNLGILASGIWHLVILPLLSHNNNTMPLRVFTRRHYNVLEAGGTIRGCWRVVGASPWYPPK